MTPDAPSLPFTSSLASSRPLATHPELEIIDLTSFSPSSLTNNQRQANTLTRVEIRVHNFTHDRRGRVVSGDTFPLGLGGWAVVIALAAWMWSVAVGVERWVGRHEFDWGFGFGLGLGNELGRSAWVLMGVVTGQWGQISWLWIGLATTLLLMMWKTCTTVLYESITPVPSLGVQLSTTRGLSFPLPFFTSKRPTQQPTRPNPIDDLTYPTHPNRDSHTSHTSQISHASSIPSPARILLPLSTSRSFVPLSALATIVINEGISGWGRVGYYLALVGRDDTVTVVFNVSINPTLTNLFIAWSLLMFALLVQQNVRPRSAVLKEVYHTLREILYDEYDDDDDDDDNEGEQKTVNQLQ